MEGKPWLCKARILLCVLTDSSLRGVPKPFSLLATWVDHSKKDDGYGDERLKSQSGSGRICKTELKLTTGGKMMACLKT